MSEGRGGGRRGEPYIRMDILTQLKIIYCSCTDLSGLVYMYHSLK